MSVGAMIPESASRDEGAKNAPVSRIAPAEPLSKHLEQHEHGPPLIPYVNKVT